jgi:small subunit ribosomal protein S21
MSIEIKIRKGEPVERALRRLKKRLDREGTIRDVRAKRYFEKPSEAKRREMKVAKFSNMLRLRHENM